MNNCSQITWCFHQKIFNERGIEYHGSLDGVKVYDIMNCIAKTANEEGELRALANTTLIKYFNKHIEKSLLQGSPSRLNFSNVNPRYSAFCNALFKWNSKESFEIGLKLLEYPAIDCMNPPEDCKDRRFEFFNYVLFPKLSPVSQKEVLNEEYLEIIYASEDYNINDVKKSDKLFEKYLKWFNEKWQDGTLTLNINEKSEK